MLCYSSRIPLMDRVSNEEIVGLFKSWVEGSPHNTIKEICYDLKKFDDFNMQGENLDISINHFKDEKLSISAGRFNLTENSVVWSTDCIYLSDEGKKSFILQLSCNSTKPVDQLPKLHKPHIIKMLMQKNLCKMDCEMPISDKCIFADEKNAQQCADYMLGISKCELPMIYISVNFGRYPVDCERLSKWVSGLAHVVAEPNKDFSFHMKFLSNKRNAHNGYVGVYYPNSEKYQLFNPTDYKDGDSLSRAISISVQNAALNTVSSSEYSWSHILNLKARQKLNILKGENKEQKVEFENFISTFDNENKELKEKIRILNNQLDSVTVEKETYKEKFNQLGNEFLFSLGNMQEFYIGEKNDLIYNLITSSLDKIDNNSRAYELLSSIIDENKYIRAGKNDFDNLKNILKAEGKITANVKSQLEQLGFTIVEEGKHFKLTYKNSKYIFTASKSPSDHRDGKNLYSNMMNRLDIYKKWF